MKTNGKPHEECAVFGVSLTVGEAAAITRDGLLALQHRGQEGAGIAVAHDGGIFLTKDMGLVNEVFGAGELETMPQGHTAVGHARYSTTGGSVKANVGPFVTEYLAVRVATAHNGNITNAKEIRDELRDRGLRFEATSDSEVASSLIARHMAGERDALSGVIKAASLLKGAFSLVMAVGADTLIAVRDPNGFRPLCLGRNEFGYAVASESCALDVCGFELVRDVKPGEVIVIENGKIRHQRVELTGGENNRGLCVFEYVYFARPDSVVDGLSVYEARFAMGAALAEECPAEADLVCGVPDSGLEAAAGYSAGSGIPAAAGLVKNRYIGRSFIRPSQARRDSAVRQKLNPLAASVRGNRVVLVDDSIVRGTTCAKIVRSLKNAGAREVHLRISSPPFRHTCRYGTDIDDEEKLIANRMSFEDIRAGIGADSLGYISLDGLKRACGRRRQPLCTACFDGYGAAPPPLPKNILE